MKRIAMINFDEKGSYSGVACSSFINLMT